MSHTVSRLTFVAFAVLFIRPAVAAQSYSFANVIDSTGPLSAISGASINNDGTLAIAAHLDSGGQGIFSFDGQTLRTIADTTGEFAAFSGLRINSLGAVAFRADYDVGFAVGGQTIFVGDGVTLTPIVDTAGPFLQFGPPIANDQGAVAFRAQLDSGIWGIFRVSGGTVTTIADASGPFDQISMSYFENTPSINGDGTVAFSGWLDSGPRGVFSGSGGAIETVLDTTGPFVAFGWAPVINDDGTVLFTATSDSGSNGLFQKSAGGVTLIAEDSATAFGLHNAVMNVSGDVAFAACFLDQDGCAEYGVVAGPDPATDTVIREGDSLFGATVTSVIFYYGLNDSGQIAFGYALDNGLSGIAIARPVPEPSGHYLVVVALTAFRLKRVPTSQRAAALRPARHRRGPVRC